MTVAKLLIKCYGKEFYKINAGFLIASFIMIIGYGLFIKTAGHIPQGQSLTINFILLIHFLQTPIITLLTCFLWLIYSLKCWRYIWKTSRHEDQLFWRYSATSMRLSRQFASWFIFQLYLSLPLICYWIIVLIYGLFTQHYGTALLSGLYLITLALISAGLYLYRFNFYPFGKQHTLWQNLGMSSWPKPIFSLFLYAIFYHKKLSYLLSKCFSALLIISFYKLFYDVDQIFRTAGIIALCIALAHAVLAYQDYIFTKTHLYFVKQFPYARSKIYFNIICTYVLLLLPEWLWYGIVFTFPQALFLLGLSISSILVIRSLPDLIGTNMRTFLKWVFSIFFISIILLLYDLAGYLIIINILLATEIFYRSYYTKESITIK